MAATAVSSTRRQDCRSESKTMTDAQVMAQPAAPGANVEVNLRDTLRTIWRGLTYLNFFKVRFTVNISLGLIAMVGALAIPWPGKMVVDHVILKRPIEGSYYPWFIDWFAQFLDGRSPVEMMGWIMLLVTASMVIIGMTGAAAGRDTRIMDTPLAISAVTSEDIVAKGIEDIQTLYQAIPGLSYQGDIATGAKMSIRE